MSADRETVFICAMNQGGDGKVYHTDQDCPHLQKAREVHEYTRENLHTRRECKYCAGEEADRTDVDRSHFEALKAAAEDETRLVTDGGRRRWRADVDATQTLAGVGDQDNTCPNGDPECAKPGTPPCFDCLMNGGES